MGKRDVLRVISRTPGVSLYELVSDEKDVEDVKNTKQEKPRTEKNDTLDPRIKRYIVSTSQTQQITTQSDIVSPEFEGMLQQGIGSAISRSGLREIIEQTLVAGRNFADVLFILRGGLNFDPTSGLGEIGIRTIEHYLSSQRKRIPNAQNTESDDWAIVLDGYKKLFEAEKEPRSVDLFFGDIVATGTSLQHGLINFLSEMKQRGYTLNSLNFFSIGVNKTEEIIAELFGKEEFNDVFAANLRANVLYMEGRFGLAKKTSPVKIKIPDTDFLTYHEDALTTPEFVRELLTRPEYVLESCVIYDGGKRRSAFRGHLKEVAESWEQLKKLAQGGFALQDAINERYPLGNVSTVQEWREIHSAWKEIEDSIIQDLIKQKDFLFAGCPNTSKALEELCERRIREINAKTGGVSSVVEITGKKHEPASDAITPSAATSTGTTSNATVFTTAQTEPLKIVSKPTHHLGMTTEFIENNEPTTILISGEPDRTNRLYRMLDIMTRHVKTGRGLPIGKGYLIRIIDGKEYKIPIAVATSGMGFGSTEITTMEIVDTYINAKNAFKNLFAQIERSAKANPGMPLNLIRIGTCGSHNKKVYGGDLIVATETYCPFGSVSDLIETPHDTAANHLRLGALLILENLVDCVLELNSTGAATSVRSRIRSIFHNSPLDNAYNKFAAHTADLIKYFSDSLDYKLSEAEIVKSYLCDSEIRNCILTAVERLGFDEDKFHVGPVFSKTTLFSEAYQAFQIEPEGVRKKRLITRGKVMHDTVYGSEMEIALMSAVAHLAKLKGYDVRVGGIMAVVNNPRDPSRSENPLFADTMTISMAVDRAILLGLEGAVEVYKQQYLNR
ncbi:hypothetical protein HY636_01735 [Candidatus Woesearchaeota archaeon]|nr:hypothetical protein [Candidatus Woesearchaeota archaeon]